MATSGGSVQFSEQQRAILTQLAEAKCLRATADDPNTTEHLAGLQQRARTSGVFEVASPVQREILREYFGVKPGAH